MRLRHGERRGKDVLAGSLPLVERTMIHTLLDFTLRASRQKNNPQGDFFSSNFASSDHS
jgi:hypothetical protein